MSNISNFIFYPATKWDAVWVFGGHSVAMHVEIEKTYNLIELLHVLAAKITYIFGSDAA